MNRKFSTINKDRDFKRAYSKGKSFVFPYVVIYVNKNFRKGTRVGITASKKIGTAVKRNRARRVIRQAYLDLIDGKNLGNIDFVFVARARTPGAKSCDIKRSLKGLFEKMFQ